MAVPVQLWGSTRLTLDASGHAVEENRTTASVQWQKSSFSEAQGQCVEVANQGGQILMRESDHPNTVARLGRGDLTALLRQVKAGEFDRLAA
ncbi:DUF397 domain-containing protein [Streptomyces stramineus]|uniref:DUF397 domain-containing protein n=1 Tax=Streptomyces stramineus TaxID=173861 RepID=A0ABN0ZMB0_9ACTN